MKKLFILFLFTASTLNAEEQRTPLQEYQGTTNFYLLMCEMKVESTKLKFELNEKRDEKDNFFNCVAEGKVKTKDKYLKAIETVKLESAKNQLKEYHISFLSALDGIIPDRNEVAYEYKKRQSALKGKVRESWNRFELENM